MTFKWFSTSFWLVQGQHEPSLNTFLSSLGNKPSSPQALETLELGHPVDSSALSHCVHVILSANRNEYQLFHGMYTRCILPYFVTFIIVLPSYFILKYSDKLHGLSLARSLAHPRSFIESMTKFGQNLKLITKLASNINSWMTNKPSLNIWRLASSFSTHKGVSSKRYLKERCASPIYIAKTIKK